MAINKIVYGNQTLIDLTADDITADKLAYGAIAHDKTGALITGTNTYDADTKDADATASEILDTKTAYVNGIKVTGSMTNRGSVSGKIASKEESFTIQSGFHDGSGTVAIDETEQAKIIAGNIKSGVNILGVVGTYEGAGGTGQSKTATPYTDKAQTIIADEGYDFLTQVDVEKIAYVETSNSAGGLTVTIGTVSAS